MTIKTVSAKLSPPTSIKDTFVRAAKTFVAVLISTLPVNTIASVDLSTLQVAVIAAASAAGSVVINAVLTWANS